MSTFATATEDDITKALAADMNILRISPSVTTAEKGLANPLKAEAASFTPAQPEQPFQDNYHPQSDMSQEWTVPPHFPHPGFHSYGPSPPPYYHGMPSTPVDSFMGFLPQVPLQQPFFLSGPPVHIYNGQTNTFGPGGIQHGIQHGMQHGMHIETPQWSIPTGYNSYMPYTYTPYNNYAPHSNYPPHDIHAPYNNYRPHSNMYAYPRDPPTRHRKKNKKNKKPRNKKNKNPKPTEPPVELPAAAASLPIPVPVRMINAYDFEKEEGYSGDSDGGGERDGITGEDPAEEAVEEGGRESLGETTASSREEQTSKYSMAVAIPRYLEGEEGE